MNKYIALLRGINVSGKNIIKMDALKTLFYSLDLKNVTTYIQSGNVVFSTVNPIDEIALAEKIQDEIQGVFNLDVTVLIIDSVTFENRVKLLPFSDFDEKNIYFTFLKNTTNVSDFEKIVSKKTETERIVFADKTVYLDCPSGYGKTKLTNTFLEKQLAVFCTTRNLKTCKKLVELSRDITF